MPGYDSAQKTREGDDLGRWRFAAEIAEVIRSTPPDWKKNGLLCNKAISLTARRGNGHAVSFHRLF